MLLAELEEHFVYLNNNCHFMEKAFALRCKMASPSQCLKMITCHKTLPLSARNTNVLLHRRTNFYSQNRSSIAAAALCGHLIANANTRRRANGAFPLFSSGTALYGFHSSPQVACLASEETAGYETPMGDTFFKLFSGSCYLPHPDKEETGGEDAHFIGEVQQAIGIADGVGGWAQIGVNAGDYARELMAQSMVAIQQEPRGSIDPARVLDKAYINTKSRGSSTVCILVLSGQALHGVNLGDSGFIIVRDGCTIFKSPVQQHDFNCPFQLESGDGSDLPQSAQVFTIQVAPGDIIIAGTDGLFDNLYDNEVSVLVADAIRDGMGPQATAKKIASFARQRAEDGDRDTPFSTAAQHAGFAYHGGKLDDITVVVSYVTAAH
eukprot:Gb_21754 [translate_table: standard]